MKCNCASYKMYFSHCFHTPVKLQKIVLKFLINVPAGKYTEPVNGSLL